MSQPLRPSGRTTCVWKSPALGRVLSTCQASVATGRLPCSGFLRSFAPRSDTPTLSASFASAQGSNCTVSDGITRAAPDRAQPSLMIRLSSIQYSSPASSMLLPTAAGPSPPPKSATACGATSFRRPSRSCLRTARVSFRRKASKAGSLTHCSLGGSLRGSGGAAGAGTAGQSTASARTNLPARSVQRNDDLIGADQAEVLPHQLVGDIGIG